MRISTCKTEPMFPSQKRVDCHLNIRDEMKFKYDGVLFMSEGNVERKTDKGIREESGVMKKL